MSAPPSYIFAGSRSWNKEVFNALNSTNPGLWFFVSTPHELELTLKTTSPRYIFFIHWNWKVPKEVWNKHECICFHMTDVPYGRGGSPLQNLILSGHNKTMLTALRMVEEIDSGPVYIKIPLELHGSAEDIYRRAGVLSIQIISWIIENHPIPTPQTGEVVTFIRRKPEQSSLPYSGTLESAYNFIRMLDADGYPNAFIEHGEFMLEFRKAQKLSNAVFAEVKITKKCES